MHYILGILGGSIASAAIFNSIRGALFFGLKFFLGWILFTFGIGLVSYAAISPFTDLVFDQVLNLLEFPPLVQNYLGVLRFDQVITVWISVVPMKIASKALVGFKWDNLKVG